MNRLRSTPAARLRLADGLRAAIRASRRRVAEPAACPPGWRTGPPDFVGVGAQRAGTQWWYGLIADHPGAHTVAAVARRLGPRERPDRHRSIPTTPTVPIRRELHFFDSFAEREFDDGHAALYHCFFPRREGGIAGEWTPRYMLDYWTPRLLRRAAPDARLLVLLRDPVERYLSGLSIEVPIARSRAVPLAWLGVNEAVARGMYARQLAALLEHFDRDRILVLQYERCRDDPAAEIRRTYEFLGLDPDHVPGGLRLQAGPRRPKPALAADARRDLISALVDDVQTLVAEHPEIDVALWPSFRDAL